MLLELRNALVRIVTAVHSTSGAQARLRDVDLWNGMLRHHAGLQRPVKIVGLVVSRVAVVLSSRCGELPTAFPRKGTGVLQVLTGTHPCDTSTQAGWWRYQTAS